MSARFHPALDVVWPPPLDDDTRDRALALLDDHRPGGVEDLPWGLRVFFTTAGARDRAAAALQRFDPRPSLEAREVSDEAWAERSQADLGPVVIGRIVVAPPWVVETDSSHGPADRLWVSILPSTGFGTGHHPSTRQCLALLQEQRVRGRTVLDVGTGSGVLAVAAARLGASAVVAIDADGDAVRAAREGIGRNDVRDVVTVVEADILAAPVPGQERHDLVLANLTGAVLRRSAHRLVHAACPGGCVIAGGLQRAERDGVVAALASAGAALEREASEDDWVALLVRAGSGPAPPRP